MFEVQVKRELDSGSPSPFGAGFKEVSIIACVVSVSVGSFARVKHFSFFGRSKIGPSTQKSSNVEKRGKAYENT